MPPAPVPILLAVHIALAVALFLPSILLPFALRPGGPAPIGEPRSSGRCSWLQSHGTLVVGAGLAATGVALIAVLGPSLLGQPWLLVALAIYAANLASRSSSSGRTCGGSSACASPTTTPPGALAPDASATSPMRWPASSVRSASS